MRRVRVAAMWLRGLPGGLIGHGQLAATVPLEARANFRRDLVHAALTGVFVGVINNYFTVVARRLGASEIVLAFILAGPFVGSLLSVLSPYLLNVANPTRRIAALWGLGRLLWVGALFVGAPAPYAAMVVAFQIVASIPAPGYAAVMQRAYPAAMRGRLLGASRTAMAVLSLAVTPAAGPLMDRFGFGPVFALAGVAGALGAVAFARIQPPGVTPSSPRNPLRLVRTAARVPGFFAYAIAYNLFLLGVIVMAPAIPVVLVNTFDASFTTVGALTLAQGIAWAFGFTGWGRVIDRTSGPFASWAITFVHALVPVVFVTAILIGNVWLLLVAYVAQGVSLAGMELGWQTSLMSMAPPEQTSSLATTFFVLIGVRGLVGVFAGGLVLLAGGPYWAFGVSLALIALGNVLMGRVVRRFVPAR
ncbi:MAG: hypothetical protein FJ029_00170 [Actinobacteria bacterium]|nr:hypothetical protein [Actinomycetota bacterium]